jgi:hypothetical protein
MWHDHHAILVSNPSTGHRLLQCIVAVGKGDAILKRPVDSLIELIPKDFESQRARLTALIAEGSSEIDEIKYGGGRMTLYSSRGKGTGVQAGATAPGYVGAAVGADFASFTMSEVTAKNVTSRKIGSATKLIQILREVEYFDVSALPPTCNVLAVVCHV